MPIFIVKLDFGTIFDFRDLQKGSFWTTVSAQRLTFRCAAEPCGASLPRPCFHETVVINVPLGPTVFFFLVFGIEIDPLFFICFSVCYLLPHICITTFHNTTVNAKPLSPPNFEKIAPQLKRKKRFSLFWFVGFAFCFYIYLKVCRFSGTPSPLGQNASIKI